MHLKEKSKGVMVGLASGDALGALAENIPNEYQTKRIEFMAAPLPLKTLIEQANTELTFNHLQTYIDTMCLPGLYTDDTQQALCVAHSLITNKGVNQRNLANLYIKGARQPGYTDYGIFRHAGPGFRKSVNNLMIFKPLHTSGVVSAGNGAAMRIAPIGIYFRDNIDQLLRATIDLSLITHRDIRGIAAAGLISYTVAYLFNKSWPTFDSNHFLAELNVFIHELENIIIQDYPTVDFTSETKHQVSNSLVILDIWTANHEAAVTTLTNWARLTSGNSLCKHNSPFALASVLYSLYLFINRGIDWENAVLTAVNGGGDADTIAAMVSAMCGAIHGYSNIPTNWTEKLLNIKYLEEISETLITGQKSWLDFIETEKQLCKMEIEYRNKFRKILHASLGFS
ncbi:MAG TPA: ADP-ribosylglycohydrolase family protein [Syntrophomonadaceae bacterium]|nr:ADP-ribosylglycohydrolase family protein [Syntrophomonadaceae bacterium]